MVEPVVELEVGMRMVKTVVQRLASYQKTALIGSLFESLACCQDA